MGLSFALSIALGSTACIWLSGPGKPEASQPLQMRQVPISIEPLLRPCMTITDEDMARIRAQVQPLDERMSVSLFLHAFRVFGRDSKYDRGKLASSNNTLRLFGDDEYSRQVFGTPLIVRTPFGIRCNPRPGGGARESHRDYCLAVLSEQGVPGAFPMMVGGKPFMFHDFLADSIANFHLNQEEIEWTALAYAMWLPPERRWTNKFAESFSFDDLANELMRRPLNGAVCAGSHLVQAMIVLSRVDREVCPILSPQVRGGLLRHLKEIVEAAQATQAADGSWGPDWHAPLLRDSAHEAGPKTFSVDTKSFGARFLVTSHVPEWVMLLPEQLQASDEMLQRAGCWLHAQLTDAESPFVEDHFCPCTHGAIVLQLLRNTTGDCAAQQSPDVVSVRVHERKNVQ
jgi:hypothetical protein